MSCDVAGRGLLMSCGVSFHEALNALTIFLMFSSD